MHSSEQLLITLFHRLTELSSDPHKDLEESVHGEQLQRETSDQQAEQVDLFALNIFHPLHQVSRDGGQLGGRSGPVAGGESERACDWSEQVG